MNVSLWLDVDARADVVLISFTPSLCLNTFDWVKMQKKALKDASAASFQAMIL